MMENPPQVSVVMPVWRADPAWLRLALRSVLEQTLRDLEVIVVEDPSERPAGGVIRDLGDGRVRHVVNEARTSIVDQHNKAVSLARSALVARFDADDVCAPDRLEKQKAFLEQRPDVGVVGCQLDVIDETGQVIGRRRYPIEPAAIRAAFPRYNPIANPGVMFRKTVVQEFGGWTHGSNGTARDYEWFSRLAAAGVRLANLDEPLVRYRLHGSALKRRKLRETLRTTWEVKRDFWLGEMTTADRIYMLAERLLAFLPARLVLALFRRLRLERGRIS